MKSNVLKKMFNLIFRKKEELQYPDEIAIVDYTPTALENGIKDNRNKIIKRYFYNKFGNLQPKIKL